MNASRESEHRAKLGTVGSSASWMPTLSFLVLQPNGHPYSLSSFLVFVISHELVQDDLQPVQLPSPSLQAVLWPAS